MVKNFIIISFEIERAKRISSGIEEGKIMTRDGRDAKVIFWDRKDLIYPIIAKYPDKNLKREIYSSFTISGLHYSQSESDEDLVLSVPNYKF